MSATPNHASSHIVSPYASPIPPGMSLPGLAPTEARLGEKMARITQGGPRLMKHQPRPKTVGQQVSEHVESRMAKIQSSQLGKSPFSMSTSSMSDSESESISTDIEVKPVESDMSFLAGTQTRPLHEASDGRPYLRFRGPDGVLEKSFGVIFPSGYNLHHHPKKRFICPVRTCSLVFQTINSLGGHFGSAHSSHTYNDNGDGTLSHVGNYTSEKRTSPAIVVSRNPLPPGAPPAKPPTDPPTYGPRKQTPVPLPNIAVLGKPSSVPPRGVKWQFGGYRVGGEGQWKRQDVSNTMPSGSQTDVPPPIPVTGEMVSYLHGYLSPDQEIPTHRIINSLIHRTRRRDLPDTFLHFHNGNVLDSNIYICALAYMVGDEVVGASACNGPAIGTARLSKPCVVLPADFPKAHAYAFSTRSICVGCKYWTYVQRRGRNICRFDTGPADDESESEPSCSVEPVPKRRKIIFKSREFGSVGLSDLPKNGGREGGAVQQMEAWELAPGRFPNNTSSETFAWSGAYMTQGEPITVADDIGIHVLVVKSGSNKRWDAADNKIRICYIAEGKLRVKMGEQQVEIGRRGTFKIPPGESCTIENRQYSDAEISCTTVNNYAYVTSMGV